MNSFLSIYLLCAVIGSTAFVLLSVRHRAARKPAPPPASADAAWIDAADPFDNTAPADVRAAAAVALRRIMPVLGDKAIRLTVAMRPGLLVQEPGHRVADLVERMVTALIRNSGSHIVLSAAPRGGQVAICVSNDTPTTNLSTLRAQVRPLTEEVALRGGALEVAVTSGQGASLVLRMARYNGEATLTPSNAPAHPELRARPELQPSERQAKETVAEAV